MRERVARCLEGQSVLCAVSGGVDSVVLLHLLLRCGLTVEAAHVEHGIRGEDSQRDCRFVQELCRAWGVRLHVTHLDVPGQAAKNGKGLEETARRLRYDYLYQVRAREGLSVIATAHHRKDQAETVLMHLIRGASPAGLSGMRERDGLLVRPLLPFSREEIEQYARQWQLPHVEDATNADTAYTRNYIRHELLPRLERVNPRAEEAIARAAEQLARQSDYLLEQAEKCLRERRHGQALEDLSDLHPGLRGVVLAQYLKGLGISEFTSADIARLEDLLSGKTGRRVSLGKELFERDTNGLRRVILSTAPEESFRLLTGVNRTPFGIFTLREGPVPEELNLGPTVQVFDAERLEDGLWVRTRRAGDRISLLGGGTRKLSDVFIDRKVPRALRDRVPLVGSGEEILWAVGTAVGKKGAVGPDSRRVLIVEVQELKE